MSAEYEALHAKHFSNRFSLGKGLISGVVALRRLIDSLVSGHWGFPGQFAVVKEISNSGQFKPHPLKK
jgi:hypothetical protein